MPTAIPDMWSELCLVGITPQGGSEIQFAGIIEDITAIDLTEKGIDSRPLVNGGHAVHKKATTKEGITLKLLPIGVGGTSETTATGIMALFHPPSDGTQPRVIPNTLNRLKFRIIILWTTDFTGITTAATTPGTGLYAQRMQIFNAYLVSAKPNYDDKGFSVEARFEWAPFQKDATRNVIHESTDDTALLSAATSFP